ncbi:MAG TPA: hypothetical protein VHB21_16985 [Minicystis sp.]|nr:hypothetical protein [Minicystis sp.]
MALLASNGSDGSPARAWRSTRRLRRASALCAVGFIALVASACTRGRGADDPSSQQGPQPGQGQLGQPGMAQPGQPGGVQPGQPGYGQPGQPGAPAATPSPLALPCQNDLICGTHKCNLQTGRCSFPCATNADCQGGFTCNTALGAAALCVPGGATQ